jgi:hypothetical protein
MKEFTESEFFHWVDSEIRPQARIIDLDVFGGHPDERWEIAGFKVGWPYPCLIVGTLEHFSISSMKLMKTKYYENFSQYNLDYLGVPKIAKTNSS